MMAWYLPTMKVLVAIHSYSVLSEAISVGPHVGKFSRPRIGGKSVILRGGGSDPSGIWNTFTRIGQSEEGSSSSLLPPTICGKWGQASCKKRSQPNVTFRIICTDTKCGEELYAVCDGPDGSQTRIHLSTTNASFPIWQGEHILAPGEYKFKYVIQSSGESGEKIDREFETLQGMWGIEQHRPLSVLEVPKTTAVLLMSDIDGTLVGDNDATDKFFWIWNEQYRPRGSQLVYNTGRPFYSAHRLIKEHRLLPPRALVCSEGTEIYWFGPGGADDVEPDYEWREILMLSWDYPQIKEAVQGLVQQLRHEVNEATYLPDTNGQPMIVINVPDGGKADNMAGRIVHELRGRRQLAFEMTRSCGGGNHFLLLYPRGAGKGSAALHCSRRLGFAPGRVMVAGDGENDVPLFEVTREGFRGAIVGNACEGLRSWVQRSPSGNLIHRSMSSQALGVLEGLHHHFSKEAGQQ